MRRVKMRLAFAPDGSVKGLLGGYQALSASFQPMWFGGLGAAVTADWDCPSVYAAIRKMADGDRDPATGQCTTISSALELRAVPAFVRIRDDDVPVARKQ
jgi:hypothetical protein